MTARLTLNEKRLVRQARLIQSKTDTIAVVKNDGYNHGLERVYRTFYEGGIRAFSTTVLSEAIQLRKWNSDIFILLLDPSTEFQLIKEYDITLTVSSYAYYEKYKDELKGLTIQLVFRNDLNRLGFDRIADMKHILDDKDLNVNGIWTHFASADDFGVDRYQKEKEKWQTVIKGLHAYLPGLKYIHAQNSASFLRDGPLPHHTHIRGGVILYGARPYYEGLDVSLAEQVVSIEANVIELTSVEGGQTIGYSADYQLEKDAKIAVCDIGYGNGLLKARKNFPVLINRKAYPIRSIMMSHILIEVDDDVAIGDSVILYNDELRFDWFASQGIGPFSQQMASLNKQTFELSIIK
ncbi:alanine racemase [Alkalibacterium sp. f15]|uniref:alanine racemase n=1 Tax=Alkalibacterium sp. f15 TaxID=3414029 RepID=UPI003BF7F3F0